MKKRLIWIFPTIIVFSLLAFPARLATDNPRRSMDQEPDYMRKYLLRNTQPLGLNEDQILQKYLAQPSIKWAIRASRKHILN